jgi:ABC-type branched-subunit amino acid transport system ATPase component
MTQTNTSPTALLSVKHLNAWYGAAQVLFNAQLHVQRGEVVALIGRNGAGKSSTLKAIMGLMPRRTGHVILQGTTSRKPSLIKPRDWAWAMCQKTAASSPT